MNTNKKAGRPFQEVKLNKKQEVRCLEEDKIRWALAAKLSGHKNTSEYIRDVVNKHSKRVITNKKG